MTNLPDDPIIRSMEKTGYPPGYGEETPPECPVCGEECETVYKDYWNTIVGCEHCVKAHDAWDVLKFS